MNEELLEVVRSAMRARSITQAELARRLGVSPSAVHNALSSTRGGSMTIASLERYLDALDVRLEFSVSLDLA